MYKILHLPTGTFVKYNRDKPTDWSFVSLESAQNVLTWPIVVDYDLDNVMLDEVLWYTSTQKVIKEQLEIVEVDD
jgi:hypothetical protein